MSKQKADIGVAHQFSAVIDKQGINPCVKVPERITRPFLRKGYIAVRGLLNKHPFRATPVSVGNGKYRLCINSVIRKAANVDVGDEIKIALEPDNQPRTIPILMMASFLEMRLSR